MGVFKKLFVTAFFIALLLPVTSAWWQPYQTTSTGERRTLAVFPEVNFDATLLSEFPKKFESFLNDHFGYRERLIYLLNFIRVKTGAVWYSGDVVIGKEGWLFHGGPHIPDIRNAAPFGPGELGVWAKVQDAKYHWLKERGVRYLFVITPNKHLIYPEHLPGEIDIFKRESRREQLVSYMKETTPASVLDLTDSMLALKNDQQVGDWNLYYKTDTHWNSWGAYFAYLEIIDRLNNMGLNIEPYQADKNSFQMLRSNADLSGNLGLGEALAYESPEFRMELAPCAQYHGVDRNASLAEKNVTWFGTTCAEKPLRLLMFRDSYALAPMPFLFETFGYVYFVPHSPANFQALKELVEQHKPDIVIEQRASRWLRTPEG